MRDPTHRAAVHSLSEALVARWQENPKIQRRKASHREHRSVLRAALELRVVLATPVLAAVLVALALRAVLCRLELGAGLVMLVLGAVLAALVQRAGLLPFLRELLPLLLQPRVPPLAVLPQLEVGRELLRERLLALAARQPGAVELPGTFDDSAHLEVLRDLRAVEGLHSSTCSCSMQDSKHEALST